MELGFESYFYNRHIREDYAKIIDEELDKAVDEFVI